MTDWPDGYGRIVLTETDSTMAEAARRADQLSGPTWILAHSQTAPHGRRGRHWQDSGGNFAATLAYRPAGTLADAGLRSFVAAVALFDTLAEFTSANRLGQKWPNDVLLDGRKLAGILLETSSQKSNSSMLAVGIGVNLISYPGTKTLEGRALAPTSLVEATGSAPDTEVFLDRLAVHFDRYERQFCEFGFEPIRAIWLRNAVRLGQQITARTMRETHVGVFEGVDINGGLVLKTGAGLKTITAADVFF